MRMLGSAGIPAGAVLDSKELVRGPNFYERGILQPIQHPAIKDYAIPAWPVRHDGAPPAVERSPLLGEHSAEVLKSWLGMSDRDVEGLTQEKVITRHEGGRLVLRHGNYAGGRPPRFDAQQRHGLHR